MDGGERAELPVDQVGELVRTYLDRYGRAAKPARILVACWERLREAPSLSSLPTDELIASVWREELARLPESRRATRVAQLRNSFSVNKRILNRRLQELADEGKNPLHLGVTEANVLGVSGDRIEDLARREGSAWYTEWISFELEILDAEGRESRMRKRERLVPLARGLTQFTHEVGSDGEVHSITVLPGRVYRQDRKAGKLEVLQVFDTGFPLEGGEVQLEYLDKDAYRNVNEYWIYTCSIPTRGEVTLSVHFPLERFPREASAYLVGPGWSLSLLPSENQPMLSIDAGGRHRLRWRIVRPRFRERYEIRWRW